MELGKLGKVKGYMVDVSDNKQVQEAYQTSVNECGDIDILINNAGIMDKFTGRKTDKTIA